MEEENVEHKLLKKNIAMKEMAPPVENLKRSLIHVEVGNGSFMKTDKSLFSCYSQTPTSGGRMTD